MIINGVKYKIAPKANLCNANLREANLRDANLCDANLYNANLYEANLRKANLRDANLSNANLSNANLSNANLRDANLCNANLCDANLYNANLCDANLYNANLYGVNLYDADLSGVNLRHTDLYGANLSSVKNISPLIAAQLSILPEGDLIGYKKLFDGIICRLKIPADAKRSNAAGRKCRAEYAIVLDGEGVSIYDRTFKYKIGAIIRPKKPFCGDPWQECESGIHFYLTRIEAENHN